MLVHISKIVKPRFAKGMTRKELCAIFEAAPRHAQRAGDVTTIGQIVCRCVRGYPKKYITEGRIC